MSHHPPVGAAHAENKEGEYDMVSAPTTKFLGNSIDIFPIGQHIGFWHLQVMVDCTSDYVTTPLCAQLQSQHVSISW